MARKNVLAPTVISASQSLAAPFNSAPTVIDFLDNITYQINVTPAGSEGTFEVQGSLDYVRLDPLNPLQDSGNWATLDMSGIPFVDATADTILISLNQLPFHAIRLRYISTVAGAGTAEIIVMAKSVGA